MIIKMLMRIFNRNGKRVSVPQTRTQASHREWLRPSSITMEETQSGMRSRERIRTTEMSRTGDL
jgi:hypothetical protein